jgi:hypothetical protein
MAERGGKREGAGRPKGSPNRATVDAKMRLAELAKQHAATAIETLAEIAENGQTDQARIAAACARGQSGKIRHHTRPETAEGP